MQLDWTALATGRGLPAQGAMVELEGAAFLAAETPPDYALLLPEAACCLGCRPDPAMTVEVLFDGAAPPGPGPHRIAGTWHSLPPDDPAGWRWQLRDARPVAAARALAAAPRAARRRAAALRRRHRRLRRGAGALRRGARPGRRGAADGYAQPCRPGHPHPLPVAAARAAGRADAGRRHAAGRRWPWSPTARPSRLTPDRRIEAYRAPAAGELYAHSQAAFARLELLVSTQQLAVVADQAGLRAALQPGAAPAVVVASEGADWLEGRLERLEQAYRAHGCATCNLVHYRVNELGDIQTAAPVHEGLTEFGAEVVRACNRRGVVVDVAHGTYLAGAARGGGDDAAAGALAYRPVRPARAAQPLDHPGACPAGGGDRRRHRRLAGDRGRRRRHCGNYAAGIARMVDAVGIEHVGIGSDMQGLVGTPAFGDYRETPALAEALLRQGFAAAEAASCSAATMPACWRRSCRAPRPDGGPGEAGPAGATPPPAPRRPGRRRRCARRRGGSPGCTIRARWPCRASPAPGCRHR